MKTLKLKKQLRKLELKGTILGLIIGDGHIFQRSSNTAALIIVHTQKQADYCIHKMDRIKQLLKVEYNIYDMTGYDKRSGNYYPTKRGVTRDLRYFKKIKDLLYPNNKKTITKKILSYLTPEGLAYWYMDDGCLSIYKSNHGGIRRYSFLSTQCFSYEEHLILQQYFEEKWDIESKINKCGKNKKNIQRYRLVFNVKNTKKLFEIINPYIIPSMNYKIDMKYSNVPERN